MVITQDITGFADAPSPSQAQDRIIPRLNDLINLKLGAQDAWRIGKVLAAACEESCLLSQALYRAMDARLCFEAKTGNDARYESFLKGIRRGQKKVWKIISPYSLGGFLKKQAS